MTSEAGVELAFGAVQFIPEREAVLPTTTVDGNVTINNSGSPGRPAHFIVTFMLTYRPAGELVQHNTFHWTEIVTGMPGTPYLEVEAQAARQLAPSLRAAAVAIEQSVAEFDQKQAAPSSGPAGADPATDDVLNADPLPDEE